MHCQVHLQNARDESLNDADHFPQALQTDNVDFKFDFSSKSDSRSDGTVGAE